MARFLIEVPHDSSKQACARAVEWFLRTGSHFLTHADWGCKDGVHKAWVTVDLDTRDEAKNIIPPPYRAGAKVVQLNAFTMKDVEDILRPHGD
jgi:hypothetical protein